MGGGNILDLPAWAQKILIKNPSKVITLMDSIKAIYYPQRNNPNVGIWCDLWKNHMPCPGENSLCPIIIDKSMPIPETLWNVLSSHLPERMGEKS